MEINITIKIDDCEVVNVTKEVETEEKTSEPVSQYARFFDESCPGYNKDTELNLLFLKSQQAYANSLLKSRGHVFLNEVYDMLGFPRSKAGAVVGWIYKSENPTGDNYIDFGIFDGNDQSRSFVNGYERTILLDFNVDGNILELI